MILGVSGKAAHGKDTVGAYLVRCHGFTRLGFADALKGEVQRILPRTLRAHFKEHFGREATDEDIVRILYTDRTPVTRVLLQEWGTDLRRSEDADYWTSEWARQVARLGAHRVVVTDVRFVNEAEMVLRAGGKLIRVVRPGFAGAGDHVSETALDDWTRWDLVVRNDGSIEDLEEKVGIWMETQTFPHNTLAR